MLYLLLCLVLLCFHNAVLCEGLIEVRPASLESVDIRNGENKIELWFTENDQFIANGPPPAFHLVVSDTVSSPHGVGTYWSDLCSLPCVTIVNSSFAVLTIGRVPEFDAEGSEIIEIVFERALFGDKHARTATLRITQDDCSPTQVSTAFGAAFQIAVLTSSVLLPTMVDAHVVGLMVQRPCETAEQFQWLPHAKEFAFLMAGETIFDLSWRAVVLIGAAVFVGVLALGLFPVQLHSRTIVRTTLPLVLVQIVNVWSPSLLFASIYLVSFGLASQQVWGAFLFIGLAILGCGSLAQVFRDPSLVFIQHGSSGLFRNSGHWLNPRYCILLAESNTATLYHVNRILLPLFFGRGKMLNHLLFIVGNSLMIVAVGIQGRSPTGCFVQGCCVTGYLFLSAFAMLKLSFNSSLVMGLSFIIRILSCVQLVALVALPTASFYVLFIVATGINSAALIFRSLFVIVSIVIEGIKTECSPAQVLSVAEPLLDGEEKEKPANSFNELAGTVHEEPPDVGDVEDEFPNEQSSNRFLHVDIDHIDKKLAVQKKIGDLRDESQERPAWLAQASSSKPKPKKQDVMPSAVPSWYPPDRPFVRTTNEADAELDLAPFSVRKTSRPL